MISILVFLQIACYQLCAVPGIVRIIRRGSSQDLSIWREVLIMVGASMQMLAMWLGGVGWIYLASPITSFLSVASLLGVILWFRRKR